VPEFALAATELASTSDMKPKHRTKESAMSYPYYGGSERRRGRWEEDQGRWEADRNREYDRGQHEGSRFDEDRWRGRERWEGGSSNEGYYGSRGGGQTGPGWGGYGERHQPYGYQPYRYPERDERHMRGEEYPRRDQDDDRGPLERFGEKLREGFRRLSRGPKGFKRSDDRITEDVCERIARSAINAENVEVTVKDGEVTLSGFVDVRYDKRILEDIADDVFGVSEVHNQLRVQRQASAEQTGSERSQGAAPTKSTSRVTHS
jgi:predicted amino acid-binding ACT domain protein